MSLQLGLDLAVEETSITDPGVKAAVELQLGLDVGWSGSPRSRLQLGLDLAVEETTSRGAESVMSTIASIGPRPRGRGNLADLLVEEAPPQVRFNWASPSRSRKPGRKCARAGRATRTLTTWFPRPRGR